MDGSNDTSSSSSSPNPNIYTPPPPPNRHEQPQEEQQPSISYRVSISVTDAASSAGTREDIWSCVVIFITFWFFASMTVILGFYGSVDLLLGPNCSRLLQVNSLFVQDITVQTAGAETQPGRTVLYGFSEPPPLDIQTSWSETHNASIPPNFHKEWIYYLNSGAQIDVSYTVNSQGSNPLALIIAQGKESFIQSIEDPFNPNSTLSWNLIHGSGMIQQNIFQPSDYYVAVVNLNNLKSEVHLNFKIQTLLYNTAGAYYKCSLDNRLCVLKLFFLGDNVGILETSDPEQAGGSDERYVTLSYGPRWITYFAGSGLMTLLIVLVFKILTNDRFSSGDPAGHQAAVAANERTPLLPDKDDDENSSLGSSYESVSHDEEDVDGWFEVASKVVRDGEIENTHHLCAICCDAQRDCFFLPCGHCATCFSCGTRITYEAGTCPICRKKMKKVRKIFTV